MVTATSFERVIIASESKGRFTSRFFERFAGQGPPLHVRGRGSGVSCVQTFPGICVLYIVFAVHEFIPSRTMLSVANFGTSCVRVIPVGLCW